MQKTNPADILYNAYKEPIIEQDRRCTSALIKEWESKKPFAGKKVLVNCHITLSTLIILETLIRGGAEVVDVTATSDLVVHENVLVPIKAAGLTFYERGKIPSGKQNKYYDIVFDCGAGLLSSIVPKVGMVELTHTEPSLYSKTSFPVVTVDTSKTKKLETGKGTGDGFVRALMFFVYQQLSAFSQLIGQRLLSGNLAISELPRIGQAIGEFGRLFEGRKYVLFGYGKVGCGIASALSVAGVANKDICIVDVDNDACNRAIDKGYRAILLNSTNLPTIKKELATTYCAVTATGQEGAISKYFEPEDFKNVQYCANMGTPDEFGSKFSDAMVLNEKKLFNFILPYPTEVVYLEAIFYILLKAGHQLITDNGLKNGIQSVDPNIDTQTFDLWKSYNLNS